MKFNLGKSDRLIRVIVGLAILAAGVAFKSWWGLIGLLPLLTAIFGFCGLYAVLGSSTCKSEATQVPRTS